MLSIFESLVVVDGVVFVGVGEAQKLTDNIVAKTSTIRNQPLGQCLGEHIFEAFLAGTFILGIAVAYSRHCSRGNVSLVALRRLE